MARWMFLLLLISHSLLAQVPDKEAALKERYKFLQDKGAAEKDYLSKNNNKINPDQFNNQIQVGEKKLRVGHLDNILNDNLDTFYDKMSSGSGALFMQNYIIANSQILKDDDELKAVCDKAKSQFCQDVEASKELVKKNINRMFAKVYDSKAPDETKSKGVVVVPNTEIECKQDPEEPLGGLLTALQASIKKDDCADLKPGEHKVFNYSQSKGNNQTGDYLLKRLPNGKYQAVINMGFKVNPLNTTGPDVLPTKTPADMTAKVKRCLEAASSVMKGPNGESLEITILSPSETERLPANQRPAIHEIGIENPTFTRHETTILEDKTTIQDKKYNFRTNSANYPEDVPCSTVTHEVLHLFGLCDEYHEEWETQYASKCRVVPAATSIMKMDGEAFNHALSKTTNCKCDAACQKIMNSTDENAKKLYTGQSFGNLTDYQFRTHNCDVKGLPSKDISKVTESDKRTIVTATEQDKLKLETRKMYYYPTVVIESVECHCPADDKVCHNSLEQIAKLIPHKSDGLECPNGHDDEISFEYGPDRKVKKTSLTSGVLSLVSTPNQTSLLHPAYFNKILGGACGEKSANYNQCAQFSRQNEKCEEVPKSCQDDSFYLGTKQ